MATTLFPFAILQPIFLMIYLQGFLEYFGYNTFGILTNQTKLRQFKKFHFVHFRPVFKINSLVFLGFAMYCDFKIIIFIFNGI